MPRNGMSREDEREQDRISAAKRAAAKKADTKKAAPAKKASAKKAPAKKAPAKKAAAKKAAAASAGGDTAKPMSPESYRPNVPIASTGASVFTGTNIPTAGYSAAQITHYNNRLQEAIGEGDSRVANDVLFDIAYAKKGVGVSQGRSEGQGQGNERVGAVQSGMYKLDQGPLWAEQYINSTNDRYVLRDEQGAPTGERVRYDDATGVVRGTPGNWTSTGSWGGNARAGIVEGQPTTTPPAKGLISTGITDLDEGGFFATGKAGVGTGIGAGVGNLISQIPYTQPASPNFSDVMPSVNYSPQFAALTSGQGKFFAPWSTGQATPGGLIDYQIPGGDLANVTYTGGNTSLFDTDTSGSAFSSGNTTTDASGGKWVMTSDGQWIPATSEYGKILTSGSPSKYPAGHYDSNGMWIGAEGFEPDWDNVGYKHGLDPKDLDATVTSAYGISPAGTVGWGPSSTLGGIFGTGTGDPNDPGIGQIDW